MQKTVRNVSTGGAEAESVSASPGQTIEFVIRVSSVGSGTATQVIVRDTLPAGLTYQTGTTTVDGNPAADGIVGAGLPVGDMPPGRTIVVRFRALLASEAFFPVGTTTLVNIAYVRASNVGEISDTAEVRVTRGTVVTQVPTGPGESALLALIVSAIVTLLYVGYASSERFRLGEVRSAVKHTQDDIDSLNFKR